jgi:hypothetical protein
MKFFMPIPILDKIINFKYIKSRKLPSIQKITGRENKFAIVAIIKNEKKYIKEWIEFYIIQGVEKIFIYDNGSSDEIVEYLGQYIQSGKCIIIPWQTFFSVKHNNFSIQALAYAHAICNFGCDFRWMGFFDVDEFLFPVKEGNLIDCLAQFDHFPSISIPWTNFGPNGHTDQPNGLVIENYTECSPLPLLRSQRALLRYKTIVDPSAISGMGTHYFPLIGFGQVLINENGERRSFSDSRDPSFATNRFFQLNHYFAKSLSDIEVRLQKGRVSKNGKISENYLDKRLKAYELSKTVDVKILRFVEPLRAKINSDE